MKSSKRPNKKTTHNQPQISPAETTYAENINIKNTHIENAPTKNTHIENAPIKNTQIIKDDIDLSNLSTNSNDTIQAYKTYICNNVNLLHPADKKEFARMLSKLSIMDEIIFLPNGIKLNLDTLRPDVIANIYQYILYKFEKNINAK